MFSANTGVLFFGADTEKTVWWSPVSEVKDLFLDTRDLNEEEQRNVYAIMRNSKTMTFNWHYNNKDVRNLTNVFRPFKLAKGPYRKRMIRRARKMQTNYIYTYALRKEGDEYVDERGQVRLVL